MKKKEISMPIRELVAMSTLNVKNVDCHEVGKYLRLMMSKIQSEELEDILPKKSVVEAEGDLRMTVNGTKDRTNENMKEGKCSA